MRGRWGRLGWWGGVGGKGRKLYLNNNKKKVKKKKEKKTGLDPCVLAIPILLNSFPTLRIDMGEIFLTSKTMLLILLCDIDSTWPVKILQSILQPLE